MPGNGYTTIVNPGFAFDVPAMTDAFDAFVDAVGLREFALVGHSWGGGWSLRYAQLHPERVSSLTLPGASGIDEPDVWDWRIFDVPMVGEAMVKLMGRGDVAGFLDQAFVNDERVTDELVDEVSRAALQAGDAMAMHELLARLEPAVGRWCGPIALYDGPDAAQEALVIIFQRLGRALACPRRGPAGRRRRRARHRH